MKIAIAGGSGYLGSHIRSRLSGLKGVKVYLISLRSSEEANRDSYRIDAYYDQIEEQRALVDVDTVIFAASLNATGCNTDPVFAKEINCFRKAGIVEKLGALGLRRVVNLSSIHVYGKQEGPVISEDVSPNPESEYAKLHYECEGLLKGLTVKGKLELANLRLSNVYGFVLNNMRTQAWNLVANDFARQLALHGEIRVKMPEAVRNFVPITRVIDLTTRVAIKGLSDGSYNIVNVSSSCSFSLLGLSRYLKRLHGGGEDHSFIREHTCNVPCYDCSRMMSELSIESSWESKEVEYQFKQLVRSANKLWRK